MASFAERMLGSRSLFSWIFGTFFSDSTNTSGAAGLVRQEVEAIGFGIKASTTAPILHQAQVPTSFDVVVTPARPQPKAPSDIFAELSPHVVLIEARGTGRAMTPPPAPASAPQAWLGLSLVELTPDVAKTFGLTETKGVVVQQVAPGGPAERAGVRTGDVILEIDRVAVAEAAVVVRTVAGGRPGQAVTLRLRRGNQDQELRITLGQRPAEPSQ